MIYRIYENPNQKGWWHFQIRNGLEVVKQSGACITEQAARKYCQWYLADHKLTATEEK